MNCWKLRTVPVFKVKDFFDETVFEAKFLFHLENIYYTFLKENIFLKVFFFYILSLYSLYNMIFVTI